MIQRERSFDTFESMREDNDSNSDDDIHFSQEGIADVLHEHESWTDDDDEEFDTNSAHSTPKFRAESPPTWLDDEDEREEGIEIPEDERWDTFRAGTLSAAPSAGTLRAGTLRAGTLRAGTLTAGTLTGDTNAHASAEQQEGERWKQPCRFF